MAVTEKKLYVLTRSQEGKLGLGAFDSGSGEYLGTLLYPDLDDKCPGERQGVLWTEIAEGQDEVGCGRWGTAETLYTRVIAYQDKLFCLGREKIALYNDKGEKLGETEYDFPVPENEVRYPWMGDADYPPKVTHLYPDGSLRFKVCQDKLYAVCRSYRFRETGRYYFEFYSLPIEDLASGWIFDYASFYEYRAYDLNQSDMTYEGDGYQNYTTWSVYALGEGHFWEDDVR